MSHSKRWQVLRSCVRLLVLVGHVIMSVAFPRESQDLNISCLSLYIGELMYSLNWTQVVIIHDTELEGLQLPYVKQQRYHVDEDYQYIGDILRRIHASVSPEINLIIAASPPLTLRLVREMDTFDFLANRTTDFRHNSKLVLMAPDECFLHTLETHIHHLNNVATIMARKGNCCTLEGSSRMCTLHNTHTGKMFSPVIQSNAINSSPLILTFPNSGYGYNNRHLILATVESKPYVLKTKTNGTVKYEGFAMDIWRIIARSLNLSFEVVEGRYDMLGNHVSCKWNCLVGQLVSREVDVVVSDLTISAGRAEEIDFVYPSYKSDTLDIIYRKRPASGNDLFQLVKPLHMFVYITLICACLVTLVLYRVLENMYLHRTSQEVVSLRTIPHFLWDVPKYSWEFAGSLFKQGFLRTPKTYSGKVLLSFWWLLVLLITSAYSANLIAALSSPPREFTLSSIDELTDSDYSVGMFAIGITYDDIKSSKRPNVQRLFNKMLSLSRDDSGIFLNDIRDRHIAIERVKQERHAFLIYKNSAQMFMASDCQLSLIGETVTRANGQLAFGLQKGSPLKLELDRTMRVLQESGILDDLWKKNVLVDYTGCDVDRTKKAMSLRELGGGFLVVSGGVVLSLVVLVIEICRARGRNYH